MKKAGILLSVLLLSLMAFAFPVKAEITQDEKPTFPWEMNSGVGRPYQDITGFQVTMINATHLQFNVTLYEGPPKADQEKHLNIYIAIDVNNKTKSGSQTSGDDGADWFPHNVNGRYGPALFADGSGGGHDYWEYCVCLYQWTDPAARAFALVDGTLDTVASNMSVTNSTDGKIVSTTLDIAGIKDPETKQFPTNVTIGVITAEGFSSVIGEPNLPPYPASAHIPKDTVGNASFRLYNATWGQWLEVQPAISDFILTSGNSASVSDAVGDFCTLPFNDIIQVATGQTADDVLINVTFANMTFVGLGPQAYMWTGRWLMSIGIDTGWSGGQDLMAGFGAYIVDNMHSYLPTKEHDTRDVRIHPDNSSAYWERCIVVDTPQGVSGASNLVHLYDTEMNDLGTGGIVATHELFANRSGIVSVRIPKAALMPLPPTPAPLTLTIISGQDWMYMVEDVVGYYKSTTDYAYDETHPQGYYLVHTTIPPTEAIIAPPPKPEQRVSTPPKAMGRPYQNITGVSASLDTTNLKVNVTLYGAPPKEDNETHVNLYLAIDKDQNINDDQRWLFPDEIDVIYTNLAYYWEYCLALYNWTTLGAQSVDLISENLDRTNALTQGITVTNTTDGKTVMMTIPRSAIGTPSTVTLGAVTTEGGDNRTAGKIKDAVGNGYVYAWGSQVVEIQPAIIGLSVGGSQSATDTKRDFLGKAYWDITDVKVGATDYVLAVNVTFLNVSTLSWSMGQWRLAIGIDSDHVAGSGQDWLAFRGLCDARIDEVINRAYWESCVVLDSPTDIHLYDKNFTDFGSNGIWASFIENENKVIVYIPTWNLPPSDDRSFNLTIISGMDSGNTVYDTIDTPPSYTYEYDPAVNIQGFYNLTKSIVTGIVAPSIPYPSASFNTAMGRPYQDIKNVSANYDAVGHILDINVSLYEAPPKENTEANVNIYLALDTDWPATGGQSYFPDSIDARYNISRPEYFWEYCLALYDWTGATPHGNLYDKIWGSVNAFSNSICNATVTNSTDGTIVMITMNLTLMDNPSKVTIGAVTSEDGSKIKDTVGNGTAILLGGQWIQVEPAIVDLSSFASATDLERDFCGKSFWDITGVSVEADYKDIIVETTFLNVAGLSRNWGEWWLDIAIDTDHVAGSGLYFTYGPAVGTDSTYPNMSTSCWELSVVVNSMDEIAVWNITSAVVGWQTSQAANIGKAGVVVSLNETANKVTVAIPKDNLKGHAWPDYNFTIIVVCGSDAGSRDYDMFGTWTYAYRPGVAEYGAHGCYHLTTDPSLNETGPFQAILSMLDGALEIDTVNFNLDQYFLGTGDPKLMAKFYSYAGVLQYTNSNILPGYTFTLPKRVTANINITHPTEDCISIVEILLTDDTGTTVYSVVARFVVTRTVLIQRLAVLDLRWALGYPKPIIFLEIVTIDAQWPYAPA